MGGMRPEIEIRTWPERSDVLVIDVERAQPLMQYESDPERTDDPLFDVFAAPADRAAAAIKVMERDQDYLKAHFRSDEDVELVEATDPRENIRALLLGHGLDLDGLTLRNLPAIADYLRARPAEDLYKLLVDWHDVVERHYPQGASYEDPTSWVHRSAPGNCVIFHHQAAGIERLDSSDEDVDEKAYEMFRRLIDQPLSDYSLGFFLRWVYFHMVEFPGVEPFLPIAWQEAGIS